jgi:[ribosomal protein S5]-alanine N-acetyltransferase
MTNHTDEFPQLETSRLLLREVGPQDSQAIFHYCSDPQVTEHFMEPLTSYEKAEEIAREYAGYYRTGKGIVWAVTLKDSPLMVGTCGYEILSRYDKRGEIGCDLAREHWGKGLMKEAMQAVIEYSFNRMDLNRIEARVFTGNARSLGLFQSLNFKTEGILREHRWFKGAFRDNVILSLLKRDWQTLGSG